MKTRITLLLTLLPFLCFSQVLPFNTETKRVEFSDSVMVKGQKDALFSAAQQWVMNTFSGAEEIIQEEDQTQGHLVMKGQALLDYAHPISKVSTEMPMHFILSLAIQNDQYRYVFSDIHFKLSEQEGPSRIIPIEETLLDKAEKRILLSERLTAEGRELSTEEFQEKLKISYEQYDQLQSKGKGVIQGITGLLKNGMRSTPKE